VDTGRAEICALASRRLESARACAAELHCDACFDDYRRLVESQPDALLIEVPHRAQDEIALWALEAGFDVLIGGCLSSSVENGEKIAAAATGGGRLVETGYQRRYDPAWEEIRRLIQNKTLGEPVMAVTMALWNADPHSWYYDQQESGGMPLVHLSYCYLNAVRWILGTPVSVAAVANRKAEISRGRVDEESCAVLVGFENGAFASATASYLGPEGMVDSRPRFVCTNGGILVDLTQPTITISRGDGLEERSWEMGPSPFVRQAERFLSALETRAPALNPPGDALMDLRIAAAVSASIREKRTVDLDGLARREVR
jgi:myo-inositol 2-dehydrogenase / D-chiro-inositol 1-dehydrogenase